MATLSSGYTDYADTDTPVRGTLIGHIRTALFAAMLTAVITIAFVVFSNRPPEHVAAVSLADGADYIATGDEPVAIDAQPAQ